MTSSINRTWEIKKGLKPSLELMLVSMTHYARKDGVKAEAVHSTVHLGLQQDYSLSLGDGSTIRRC